MSIQQIKIAISNYVPIILYGLAIFLSVMLANNVFNIESKAYAFGQKIKKVINTSDNHEPSIIKNTSNDNHNDCSRRRSY